MQFNHRTMAALSRYLLLAIAGSAAVQLAALWQPMWAVLAGLALLAALYCVIFVARYIGLMRGYSWAYGLRIERMDTGFLQFAALAISMLVGVVLTCLMFWT